ncbi:MAG: TetR/AcrR family transcriptional regulator [Myxococcota bacterium]
MLRAAITMADQEGLASLTMRALGAALGVQAMSLYNHVANKDALLDGIVELVVGEIEVPSHSDPWRTAMRKRAASAHAVLLRHPWACGLLMSRANVGPAMIRYIDATLGCLHQAGFPLPLADHAWNAMDSFIYGFTLQKLNFPFKEDEYSKMAAMYLPTLSVEQFPAMHALTVLVASGKHNGLHDLEFGLELLLDGLERVLVTGDSARS